MAELPAIYHDAYSFAVREWRALGLGGHPTDLQLANLRHLVSVYIFREYPGVPRTLASSAISYGLASAERDLTSPDSGGLVDTIGEFVDVGIDTIEGGVHAVESAATRAERAVSAAIRGALAAILRAVNLPRAALPYRHPTSLTNSYGQLARELGQTTPTRIASANRTRLSIRRLGR